MNNNVMRNATPMDIVIKEFVIAKTNILEIIVFTKHVQWNVQVMVCATKEPVNVIRDS